ncbi:major facilitator superfamily domain-containing protein [Gilbertella persicaria]|uniref:major facilitator superfamily domain-containing protein n=1 Tax=Gilbertella persicaria TaxID=101096 RepID=UPI002220619A|nr:major facilitator superfamily domain-containing protein [Gilbertella persicaria]KAI8080097.1 major facilitator superfamily domain-containing protein [Gilbertella persicaria]
MSSDEENQHVLLGVKIVELYKLVWHKHDRMILFCSILSTVLYILQTALLPMYSKLSDIYGRASWYTFAMVLYIISYIVMATSKTYANLVGAQVIYAFGYTGCAILGPVTIADLTSVINRGLYQGLYNVPTLINLFVTTKAGQALYDSGHLRWGYGMVPILLFVTSFPLLANLWRLQYKVKKSGLIEKYKQENNIQDVKMGIFERIQWLLIELDVVGSLLLIAGLCLILLPLVLANTTWGGWGSGITIGTLVGGVVAWALFALWEIKFSKKPIIPLARWDTRTPLYGVCALSTVTIISSTNWQYYTTYLMVSRRYTSERAQLIERGYNVAYILCEVVAGYLMKRFRVWKPFVWTGVALTILGVGLMIPARLPSSSDAFVVISQTIVGIGSGFLYTPMLVAIQSSVPHEDMAVATAMMQIGGSIAASIGSTMAGAIWNNMLPGQIAEHVPGEYDYAKIVGNVVYAQQLPDDQWAGVVQAYGYIQKILSIIALCIAVVTFCFTIPMKSFGLEAHDETDVSAGSEHSNSLDKKETQENYKPTEELYKPDNDKA